MNSKKSFHEGWALRVALKDKKMPLDHFAKWHLKIGTRQSLYYLSTKPKIGSDYVELSERILGVKLEDYADDEVPVVKLPLKWEKGDPIMVKKKVPLETGNENFEETGDLAFAASVKELIDTIKRKIDFGDEVKAMQKMHRLHIEADADNKREIKKLWAVVSPPKKHPVKKTA